MLHMITVKTLEVLSIILESLVRYLSIIFLGEIIILY